MGPPGKVRRTGFTAARNAAAGRTPLPHCSRQITRAQPVADPTVDPVRRQTQRRPLGVVDQKTAHFTTSATTIVRCWITATKENILTPGWIGDSARLFDAATIEGHSHRARRLTDPNGQIGPAASRPTRELVGGHRSAERTSPVHLDSACRRRRVPGHPCSLSAFRRRLDGATILRRIACHDRRNDGRRGLGLAVVRLSHRRSDDRLDPAAATKLAGTGIEKDASRRTADLRTKNRRRHSAISLMTRSGPPGKPGRA